MLKKIVTTAVCASVMTFSTGSFAASVTYIADKGGNITGAFSFDDITNEIDTSKLKFTNYLNEIKIDWPVSAALLTAPSADWKFSGDSWSNGFTDQDQYYKSGEYLRPGYYLTDYTITIGPSLSGSGMKLSGYGSLFEPRAGYLSLPSLSSSFTKLSSVPVPAAGFMFVPTLLGFAALRRKRA